MPPTLEESFTSRAKSECQGIEGDYLDQGIGPLMSQMTANKVNVLFFNSRPFARFAGKCTCILAIHTTVEMNPRKMPLFDANQAGVCCTGKVPLVFLTQVPKR